MIIVHPDGRIEQVPDPPSDYTCAEWKAYETACLENEQQHGGQLVMTDELLSLYTTYHEAMKRNAESEA